MSLRLSLISITTDVWQPCLFNIFHLDHGVIITSNYVIVSIKLWLDVEIMSKLVSESNNAPFELMLTKTLFTAAGSLACLEIR